MAIDGLDDARIAEILRTTRHIALVGASARPDRPSHQVMLFLLQRGFQVVPVNPGLAGQAIHGQRVVAGLADAAPLDMVDVFRAPDQVPAVMAEAIRLCARTVWLQLGVRHEAAMRQGQAAGITVVADRCPVIEWSRLRLAS